jgi:hypothetical protein
MGIELCGKSMWKDGPRFSCVLLGGGCGVGAGDLGRVALGQRLPSQGRRLGWHKGVDDLGTLGRHHARSGKEPHADVFIFAPEDFAVGFETIELDEQLKGVRGIDGTV